MNEGKNIFTFFRSLKIVISDNVNNLSHLLSPGDEMALIKCKECGEEISNKAETCPKCGAPTKRKGMGCGSLIVILFFGFFIVPLLMVEMWNSHSSPPPVSKPVDTVRAKKAAEANEKKRADEFKNNRVRIFEDINKLFEKGEYDKVVRRSAAYIKYGDSEIKSLHDRAREQLLLAKAKDIPSNKWEENRKVYSQLKNLNPSEQKYKDKWNYYDSKVTEQKRKHAAKLAKYGKAPEPSSWDGTYRPVEKYLKSVANDPDSINVESCGEVFFKDGKGWLVACKYRGKNAFGGLVLNAHWFTIVHNQVVDMEPITAYSVK